MITGAISGQENQDGYFQARGPVCCFVASQANAFTRFQYSRFHNWQYRQQQNKSKFEYINKKYLLSGIFKNLIKKNNPVFHFTGKSNLFLRL